MSEEPKTVPVRFVRDGVHHEGRIYRLGEEIDMADEQVGPHILAGQVEKVTE